MAGHNVDKSQLLDIVNLVPDTKNQEGQQKTAEGDKSCRVNDNEDSLAFQVLSPKMKKRMRALRKLQLQYINLEANFYEEVHKLECRFNHLYLELYNKREKIISGEHEPTDEECDYFDNRGEEFPKDVIDRLNYVQLGDPNVTGIPNFWLTIFKNVAMLNDMVQPYDEPILSFLKDIKVIFLETDPMGFILEFHFGENPFFTNRVLTKQYLLKCTPDEQDPFSFEGPEIYKCKGCSISWKTGKDITVKLIKKKQKHKSRGAVRVVTRVVKNDTFFNFFSPPEVNEDSEAELDDETQALLTSDFEIGHYIRERIVPNAVLYYTGEALADEEEYDEDEEDGDEDEESEEISSDSDNDSESYQRTDGGPNAAFKQNQPPPDCKQQ